MATHTFTLTIASVSGQIFSGQVSEVHVPGLSGDMQIFAGHEPLISPLKAGQVSYTPEGKERKHIAISGGVLEVAHNHCSVLL